MERSTMATGITNIDTDTTGQILGRDADKKLYIVSGSDSLLIKDEWSDTAVSWLEYSNDWGNGYNKREAIAVEAVTSDSGTITGYKLAVKNSMKNGDSPVQVTWDIYYFDANAKYKSSFSGPNGQMVQAAETGVKSIGLYEKDVFHQDLNGDKYLGLDLSSFTVLSTDTQGIKLARDIDQGLHIVETTADADGNPVVSKIVTSLAAGWLENSYTNGSDYNKREAIAVVTKTDGSGYMVSFKNSSKYGTNDVQVTYDLLSFDVKGKQVYGSYVGSSSSGSSSSSGPASGGTWVDPNVYGTKSLATYEKLYNEDLTGDGKVGISISELDLLSTDKTGLGLAREKTNKGLSVVEVTWSNDANIKSTITKVVMTVESGYLENSYINGSDYNKREAIAVVAKTDGSGYLVSFKNSNKYGSNAEQVTYDLLSFDAKGKQVYGGYSSTGSGSTWTDSNVYGVKSLAAYELTYNEDLNGDGSIGVNLANLDVLTSDSTGLRLARDKTDKSLYVVEANGTSATRAVSSIDSGNLESAYTYGNDYNKREAVAVVAKTDGSGYLISFKNSSKWGDNKEQVTFDLLSFDAKGKQVYGSYASTGGGWTDPNVYGAKSLASYETLYNEDLTGDGKIGILPSDLDLLTKDTKGIRLAREKVDKSLSVVEVDSSGATPTISKVVVTFESCYLENTYTYGSDYSKREAIAVVAKADKSGYLVSFKNSNKWGSNDEQVTYDLLSFDTKGKQVYGGYASSGNGNAWVDSNVYGAKSLASYEVTYSEDLNGDGEVGFNLANLALLATDKKGVQLARDKTDKGLCIVTVETANDGSAIIKSVVAPIESGYLESSYTNGSDYNKREAIAVVAKTDGSGYLVSFKNSNKWGSNEPQVTFDLLSFDSKGKQVSGGYATSGGSWTDPNVYGAKSLASYELAYNEDLNGDGEIGVNLANLKVLTTDTSGLRLARDNGDQSLCIVEVDGTGQITKAVAAIQSGYMENSYTYGSDYNKREAIAVTQKADGNYLVAIKSSSKWGGNAEQVTYDLLTFDAQGKQLYGSYASGGAWSDPNVYGVKSMTPYEADFNQDFNNDGYIGIDVSKLTPVTTDTKGIVLARDVDSGMYMVDNTGLVPKATAVTNGGWLEYSNNWGSGSNKREAIAVEAMADGTGYKLAMKSTNKYDSNPEQITWDILQLDKSGRVSYGATVDGAWKDSSVWGAKSVAPYEKWFGQDLNGDGSIGIDVSKLSSVKSDTSGVVLMRDTDGGLYVVDGTGSAAIATAIGNSSWMEYSNSWTGGYSKREAVAVEVVKAGSNITGYKLAMKVTNKWGDNAEQVTWDIIQLDKDAKVTYGHTDSKTNMWVDETIYGAKSIASYEDWFSQDLNGDGSQGIDIKTLTKVATDTSGVGLRRDRDNALYLVDTVNGAEVARAVSSSWLEYSNDWGSGSNKREAVAIEANADGTGYRLAMKQTNTWNGGTDTTWEVLSLDATGKVSNSYAGSGYLSTRNVSLVEDIVSQDLNADGQVGVKLSDLQLVTTDEGSERLAWSKTDKTLYIVDGPTLDGSTITAANRKLAIVDSSGMTPKLETIYSTWNGTSAAKVYAVAKQDLGNGDYQYRVAVKVEASTTGSTVVDTTWQIYTVSKDGVLDWSKVATSRNPDRFEKLFNIDFNNDGKISSDLGTLTVINTDSGDVKLKKDTFGTLYISDAAEGAANGGITYLVDSRGGAPNFDKAVNGVTSSVYAVDKQPDDSYRLAVKNVSTVGGVETTQWEVHTLTKANANFEATVDWSKVRYLSDVKEVEKLINQDIDGDNIKGYAPEPPVTVVGDQGVVTAGVDSHGRLYINDVALAVSPMAVTDSSGIQFVAQRTQSTTESDRTVSSFKTEVLAAESVTDGYKVMVKQTVADTGKADAVSYLIYSVTKEGLVSGSPVETPSPLRWESVFKQDFNADGSKAGVSQSAITASAGDSDLGSDEFGAVYVKSGDVYVPVLSTDGGNLAFTDKTVLDGMTIESKPVAAEAQQNGDYLLAVEVDVTVGTQTSASWAVHTLKVNDAGDAADWQSTKYFDQATDLTDLFHQNVAVLGA
jgi:hypothetical protein